ncbi:MAG TPA: hypothetical protein VL404_03275 [Candidatus Eisenbacteria bacterium]|nr:hypothetical protein [Candidatus Eisenbacteria bacterium]
MRRFRSAASLFAALCLLFSAAAVSAAAAQTDPSFGSSEYFTPPAKEDKGQLPGGRIRMTGHYRLAAGLNDDYDVVLNDSNADLQERNFRYLFGERLNNTYDPAIYDQFLLNVEFEPHEKWSFYTQIVADPWSYVGTTGEQITRSDIGTEVMRYNLKYFGANNSVINEIYRTNVGDSIAFPVIEVKDGQTVPTVVHGFFDFSPATGGVPFHIPALDIDTEFRPFRKAWVDYTDEDAPFGVSWHARIFPLADETQALTTDDPIGLSNHKDYWQQSPWLYQYQPVQFFSDGSIKRGYYSDSLSFLARDSEGHRLVLLRGASVEAATDRTYFAGTVAAPYTPWDDHYFDADNIPGAFRLKHRATDRLTVGGTYTFRNGLIDNSVADVAQAVGADVKFDLREDTAFKGEVAVSHRDKDLRTDDFFRTDSEGLAYKASVETAFEHGEGGKTEAALSYTQMDREFEPVLSRFSNTRDDRFWGKHLSFAERPDLEPFRLGDGVDANRTVYRAQWKEKFFKDRFFNLFDDRHVRRTSDGELKENVLRDELTVKVTPKLTLKGMFRWQQLPGSTAGIEPFLSDYYFIGFEDPSSLQFQNVAVPGGRDPSRFTYAGGAQYVFNKKWTAEGFYERTNDIPDFPRGLLNGTFRDANDRVDGLLIDHLTNFLYGQGPFGAVPPYEYFGIARERLIFRPQDNATFTFHMAQNSYRFAAAIDDNVNHQGVSLALNLSKSLLVFMDYTHSYVSDVPKLIATNYSDTDFRGHHNVYLSMDWRLNSKTVFRAEYGVFGLGSDSPLVTPYSATAFSLPTLDTEHLLRVSLTGDF